MDVISGKSDEGKLLSETDEARTIINLFQTYDKEEEFVRNEQVKRWRKHMHYWDGFQYLAWDESAGDWKTPSDIAREDPENLTHDIDPALYAKVVNIYKANGEIFIGALSSGTPQVRFFPKDADDHEDIVTARGKSKIAELIQRHNRARLLLMKSLFILYNQGMVCCYNENKADYRFGTVKEPEYGDVPVTDKTAHCPNCGFPINSERVDGHIPPPSPTPGPQGPPAGAPAGLLPASLPPPPDQAAMGGEGTGPEAGLEAGLESGLENMGEELPPDMMSPDMGAATCPQCGSPIDTPEIEHSQDFENRQIGYTTSPKTRECLEIYGPLNVRIPAWVRDQASTPYLNLETEEHVALLREVYPELHDKIVSTAYPDTYEKESRVPSVYKHDFPRNQVTVSRVWFRPWALNILGADDPDRKALKAKYPDGFYCVILNKDIVAEIVPDKLDDHWTISEQPLAETLHADPIGSPAIPMQDITNELANLTLETIEFGIPEVFADTRVLDFESYHHQEARPGQISPASAPAGQRLSDGFHEVKAGTLSREVEYFADRIQQSTQFVMGTYPSIYGGTQEGGSGTAREYELSKASALQRLSSTWTIVQEWWCQIMKKAVESFVKNMKEDESYVTSKGSNFINVWIRQSEMSGETGEVEPEISETFPISWTQKRDVIMNLMQMGSEDINAVIRHPENAGMVASIIGVSGLYIPGDDDRNKQLAEIAELIVAEPQQVPPSPENPMGLIPSVPAEQDLDDHEIEADISKAWLKSEVGMDAKKNNPAGWANVMAHLKMHISFLAILAPSPEEANGKAEKESEMTDQQG
jgi:hypothetical protein